MHYQYFPPVLIELNKEIQHHPELIKKLQEYTLDDQEIKLAAICKYVGIELDGYFTPQEILEVCRLCYLSLKEMNTTNWTLNVRNITGTKEKPPIKEAENITTETTKDSIDPYIQTK